MNFNEKNLKNIIKKFIKDGRPIDQIAEVLCISEKEVEAILKK